jgi:hypothetical protein
MTKMDWIISALRTSGERVYYVTSPELGPRMVPLSASRACRFNTRNEAKLYLPLLKARWQGLSKWIISPDECGTF